MRTNKTNTVLARTYNSHTGEADELVSLGQGRYIIAVQGQIPDARKKLNAEQARQFWDSAPYKIEARP